MGWLWRSQGRGVAPGFAAPEKLASALQTRRAMLRPPETKTMIATFASSRQALRVIDELAARGVADERLSVLVWQGARRLTRRTVDDTLGDAALGGLVGAVFAALIARDSTMVPEVDALGVGPLLDAIADGSRSVTPRASLTTRLIQLGVDAGAAAAIEDSFKRGDIMLGVDTPAAELGGVARTCSRARACGVCQKTSMA
jgi:hypothetical protein